MTQPTTENNFEGGPKIGNLPSKRPKEANMDFRINYIGRQQNSWHVYHVGQSRHEGKLRQGILWRTEFDVRDQKATFESHRTSSVVARFKPSLIRTG